MTESPMRRMRLPCAIRPCTDTSTEQRALKTLGGSAVQSAKAWAVCSVGSPYPGSDALALGGGPWAYPRRGGAG